MFLFVCLFVWGIVTAIVISRRILPIKSEKHMLTQSGFEPTTKATQLSRRKPKNRSRFRATDKKTQRRIPQRSIKLPCPHPRSLSSTEPETETLPYGSKWTRLPSGGVRDQWRLQLVFRDPFRGADIKTPASWPEQGPGCRKTSLSKLGKGSFFLAGWGVGG